MLGTLPLDNGLPERASIASTGHVVLGIGAIPISFRTGNVTFRRMLEDRYCGFLAPAAHPQFHFDVQIAAPRIAAPGDDLHVSREGHTWRVVRGDFSAQWDAKTRRGWIRQGTNPYSADTLLRVVHSIALAEKGGFLLHAASAVRKGRAFLFSGISGAGKTTLARLAPSDARILTDEISYVVKEANGYRACGTPFAGELARLGENINAPVAGLFFLEKAARNRLEKMDSCAAVGALLRNILFLARDEELVQRVFHAAMEFVSAVPIHRMYFTPDARAWEMFA